MKYKLGNREVSYEAEGQTIAGDDTVLLHHGIDLTADKSWGKIGYTIEHLFEENILNDFKPGVKQLLISLWKEAGLKIGNDFKIEHYHRIADASGVHYRAVEKTKLIPSEKFPVSIKHLEERISEICGHALRVFSPTFKQSYFHFRVIRPGQPDNNPLHRDVWVEENTDGINLYIPIAGSNENSSLAIIPGSHHWAESKVERTKEGAIIHGVKFNVPAVTNILSSFEIARPNPTENQVLVFSPYLIHGGAINLNRDETRISMEVRLWKK